MSEDEPKFPIPPGVQEPLEGFPDVPRQELPEPPRQGPGHPDKPAKLYRARYQDTTDEAVKALKEGTGGEGERPSGEEMAKSREVAVFVRRAVAETGSFDIRAYIKGDPEKTEEARRLGLIE